MRRPSMLNRTRRRSKPWCCGPIVSLLRRRKRWPMALDKDTIKSTYPLPVYNYRVTVGSLTLGVSEISGLSVEYQPVIYKHGLSFVMGAKIIPGMRQAITLTMKRAVVKGHDDLYSWLHDVYTDPFKSAKRDILIDLCDE